MASEEAPYTVSQNDGLFLHPALTAHNYRTFQRSYHLYVHHGEKHGGLRITGTPDEISGTPGSVILTWAMFTGLFVFMPNTKVKLKYAIIPGIIAGTAFQAFQYLYIGSQIWVSRYNAIYGSFAAIPMFLLWAQISWGICLYGAELCYVAQNLRNYSFSKETANISRRYHDFLCILIMSLICKRFETEETPYTAETLSDEHKIPIRLTKKILYELQDMHMVYETSMDGDDESIGYLPSVDINRMNVAMLLNRLDIAGTEAFKIDRERYSGPWEALTNAREEYYKSTSKILLKDL